MNIIDIIENKKNGGVLTQGEIEYFVKGATDGSIPDYQLSALLMSICLKGMNADETYFLTRAMKNSGECLDTSFAGGITADKHSTGGVSDTVTLVVAPVLAANGIKVVKLSGRGLSHTGGTIDKLESIHGFKTSLTFEEIRNAVNSCGAVIAEQTGSIVPADKILYALRDVTATVDSIPLICSSIMSKKLALGADIILLDVKYGSGAFMKTPEEALTLARAMVETGQKDGKKCAALVTAMEQPLTEYIGCNLEVASAISVLKGNQNDLYKVCREICGRIFVMADRGKDLNAAYKLFEDSIKSGEGIAKLREIVKCQGGEPDFIENGLPNARYIRNLYIKEEGFVSEIDAAKVGIAVLRLGGGRETKGAKIDHSAGVVLKIRLNDSVKKGDILAVMHSNSIEKFDEAEKLLNSCYKLSDKRVADKKLIYAYTDEKETAFY